MSAAQQLLADSSVDGVSAGWLGFLIVIALGVVTYLLIRNMNARLKRLPDHFGPDADEDASGPTSDA